MKLKNRPSRGTSRSNAKPLKSSATHSSASTPSSVTLPKPINSIIDQHAHMKNRTMVDEVRFTTPFKGELPGTTATVTDEDGEIIWRGQNRRELDGKVLTQHRARIRTLNAKKLQVSTSVKFLYGHNVAASENPRPIVMTMLQRIIEWANLHHDMGWKIPESSKSVTLEEIALVRHLVVPPGVDRSKLVNYIAHCCINNGLTIVHQTPGKTCSASTNRREYTVSFYLKDEEMDVASGVRHQRYSLLRSHVEGCIRIEVRLRSALLKRFDLSVLKNWGPRTADVLVSRALDSFDFLQSAAISQEVQERPKNVGPGLWRAVGLARAGATLKEHYAPSTLRRLRQQALVAGIDLMSSGTGVVPEFKLLHAPEWRTSADPALTSIAGFGHFFTA